jgi:Kdo2-lipid IVA lauroyltransferase/acyltransferase
MPALFRFFSRWPLGLLHLAGAVLGWLAFLLSPTYRRRFLANAAQAGYGFSPVRAAVAHAGRMAAELPRLWLGAPVPVTWDGAELIERAHAAGRGIVFLTPHLGCFEITAQGYATRFGTAGRGPITVLYRPARQAWLRALLASSRSRPGLATAPTTLAGVKLMLKALRAGQAVGLLPDQVPPEGLGVWAPFFGQAAYTMTLSVRLAQQSGATVLLAWGERLPGGRGYVIHLRDPAVALDADPTRAAVQVNADMERLIRECPQQYLWGYARYKQPRKEA